MLLGDGSRQGADVGIDDLDERILAIVATEVMIDKEKLRLDAPLSDLDIQSADYVMILMAVEEKFGVYISVDSELTDAATVGDLVNVVSGRIRNAPSLAQP